MAKSELKSAQFSLRSMLILSTIIAALIPILIPFVHASKQHGFFLAPYGLIGDELFPFAVLLLFLSPFLLITIGMLLYYRQPHPALVYVFLASVVVALLQVIFARPYIGDFHRCATIMSPFLLVISIASIVEVTLRQLKSHYVTACLTFPISLAYWLMAAGIASAI